MILEVKNRQSTIAPKLSYDVLIENQEDGTVKATLLNLPEYQGLGADKQAAIDNLIDVLAVKNPEIVTVEIEGSAPKINYVYKENPWLKFAGMFENDPHFEEVQQYITEYRLELDKQMEENIKIAENQENI